MGCRKGEGGSWRRKHGVALEVACRYRLRKEVGSMTDKEKDRKDQKKDGKDGGKK